MNTSVRTPLEVAVSQLRVAIALFLEVRDYREVIKLARTAEEILHKLAREARQASTRPRALHGSHQRLGAEPEKAFARFRSPSPKAAQPSPNGLPVELVLEAEAMRFINRAVENYRLLHARAASFILVYERRRNVLVRRAL